MGRWARYEADVAVAHNTENRHTHARFYRNAPVVPSASAKRRHTAS